MICESLAPRGAWTRSDINHLSLRARYGAPVLSIVRGAARPQHNRATDADGRRGDRRDSAGDEQPVCLPRTSPPIVTAHACTCTANTCSGPRIHRVCTHIRGASTLWQPLARPARVVPRTRICSSLPTRSIRAFPPPILQSTNQILFPPDREIPLVHLQSANQIIFPPVREFRLVRMHRPAFTPITLCTSGRLLCWHIAT